MTHSSDIIVTLDNRVRLISAVMAATNWPQSSQARLPHGTHAHSRATRKYVESMRSHEAVLAMQGLLDQGAPLEALFTLAFQLEWPMMAAPDEPQWLPSRWTQQLRSFYRDAKLEQWWDSEDAAWQASLDQSRRVFQKVAFKPFLQPFFGEIAEKLIFIPNISYPTEREVAVHLEGQLVCIAPPRLAWGDSPPWPFDEDPAYIYRSALTQYGRLLTHAFLRTHAEQIAPLTEAPLPGSDQFKSRYPTWQEQFTSLFVAALSALFLEQNLTKAEANSYVLLERKMNGMTSLPGMISVLRRYLTEREHGRYKTLLDFLPVFPKQLRVAAKIVSL